MRSAPIERYDVMRLHYRSEGAWAVVVMPGGSIAIDHKGDLLMRLRERDARDAVAAMTAALSHDQTPRCVHVSAAAPKPTRWRTA